MQRKKVIRGPSGKEVVKEATKIIETRRRKKANGNNRSAHKAKEKEETGGKNGDGGVLRVDESIYSLSLLLG